MKKLASIAMVLLALLSAEARDRVVAITSLPQSAQEFANANFKNKQLASAQIETSFLGIITDGYKIVYTDGTEIEFDSKGNWEKISAATTSVPADLIPEKITQYVKEHFKGLPIVEIDKKSYGFEVKLTSRQELKFNANYVFIGLD